MPALNFDPGVSSARLEELADEYGQPKAKVLRALIEICPEESGKVWHQAYGNVTKAGAVIKEAGRSGKEVSIVKAGEYVKEIAVRLIEVKSSRGREPLGLEEEEGEKVKAPMRFDPKDMGAKLSRLAVSSGLTKTEVLRRLVLSKKLPNRLERKTFARIAQAGGLLKHVARGNSKIYWLGFEICELAWSEGRQGL